MSEIRALLFDLAGVLIHFGGPESLQELSAGRITREEFFRFWSRSRWADDLHCGRCSPEDFAVGAVREFGLGVTPEIFLADFETWLRGPYPGAFELLRELRPRYCVASLSNTNVLDARRFDEEFKLPELFDVCFYSNEIGLRKPDPACYLHVIKQLALEPHEVAFFDDNLECVAGAHAVGMRAYHVDGFESLRTRLADLAIIGGHTWDSSA